MAEAVETLSNFVGGRWMPATATSWVDVHNPARGTVIARTPLSTSRDVERRGHRRDQRLCRPGARRLPWCVRGRCSASRRCSRTHFEELARLVTTEHGKTLDESRGSVRRGIECVEVACGGPSMLMGYGLENVAPGIDCTVMRQPIGRLRRHRAVQFPRDGAALVPAVRRRLRQHVRAQALRAGAALAGAHVRAARSSATCRPASSTSSTAGGRSSEAICDHPGIRAVSFVGSTPVARLVYQRATHAGKRVQALGGAKNFVDRHARCRPRSRRSRSSPSRSTAAPASGAWPAACCVPVGAAHARGARPAGRRRRSAEGWRRARAWRRHGAGHQRGRIASGCWATSSGASAEGARLALDGRATRVPDRPTASSSGRRCSTKSVRP